MEPLFIRKFDEQDLPALSNYSLPKEQAIFTSLPTHIIETYRNDPFNQPYVVYVDDELIGCFALYTDKSGNIYTENENAIILMSLSIDYRHQKKSYALKTLNALSDIIRNTYPQKDEIILTVHNTNTPAINLYIKAGFINKGLRYAGEYGDELIYHLDLTS